jgi:hypothetical protein
MFESMRSDFQSPDHLGEVYLAGGPGLDFQTWETLEAGGGENEKRRVEVHRLPHLKIEMWATQLYRSDVGHPPASHDFTDKQLECFCGIVSGYIIDIK